MATASLNSIYEIEIDMKKLFASIAAIFILSSPALADQVASASPQPCTRNGAPETDELRCELAVTAQALAQANSTILALTARGTMQANDLAGTQAEIKKLQGEVANQKNADPAPTSAPGK
jgi:peptidoglycan hydrolase CwlO-like protein